MVVYNVDILVVAAWNQVSSIAYIDDAGHSSTVERSFTIEQRIAADCPQHNAAAAIITPWNQILIVQGVEGTDGWTVPS